jgi:agmatinase
MNMEGTDSHKPGLCQLGIVGFCYDENSSFMRGAADAPPLIREALFSEAANLWSETGVDLGQPHLFFDAGDVLPTAEKDMVRTIESSIEDLLSHQLLPISLGGDHSITYPITRAVAKRYPALSILHFDAHPDLYDDFQGNRYSHASPFARIMEEKLVQRLVQVGIRTLNGHQREQAARFGVEIYEMKNWRDDLELNFETPVYISVDIDGLDPAYAPGVSHREPGGLSTRQVIDLIHRVKQPVVGADIVEFNPRMDPSNMTAVVCAKILKEIAGQMLETI